MITKTKKIDMEKINSLSREEIIVVNGLQKIAEEAEVAAELIRNTYRCFGIGEDKIKVRYDKYNTEYLTHDGIWQQRSLGSQTYDVPCTPEGIYQYFKAEYMVENGLADDNETMEMNEICKCFRGFLIWTEKKAEKQKSLNVVPYTEREINS